MPFTDETLLITLDDLSRTVPFPKSLNVSCVEGYELVPPDQTLPSCGFDGNLTLSLPTCYG